MPYVHVEIDLDDFDDDDLIEELESRGYTCSKDSVTGVEGLERIEHLAICGQTEIARADSDEKHKAAFRQSLAKSQTSKAETFRIHCSAVSLPFLRRAFFTP